ncbi:MAG: hypothetical protein LM601_03070 [Candidatus Verstraetearchaeota archaeon]|jgi:hypothetical protein|nr:hypothetical protein [Candidatus Verstraetearchaeota archaeon]
MFEELLLLLVYGFSGIVPIVYNYVIAKRIARKCYEIKPYIQSSIDSNIHVVSEETMGKISRIDLSGGSRESIFKISSISTTNDGISVNFVIDRERLMELLRKKE